MEADELDEFLTRAFIVDEWIVNDAMRQLMFQLRILPALPDIYAKVTNELRSPDASMDIVATLIARDPVMTAKMLQVVNSVCFGLPSPVSSALEAVLLLGAQRTTALVLVARVFSDLTTTGCGAFDWASEWRHAIDVASLAQNLVLTETNDSKQSDLAFTAGLLHDVGKFLFAANFPKKYAQVIERARFDCPTRQAERELFGVAHPELGGCLLGLWGLPLSIIEATAFHHDPSCSRRRAFGPLLAVHAANYLVRESAGAESALDNNYLNEVGMAKRIEAWRELCAAALANR